MSWSLRTSKLGMVTRLLLTCFALLVCPYSSFADFTGPVVSILDGNTLEVLHNQHPERIRISGSTARRKAKPTATTPSTPLGPHGSPIRNQDQTSVLWAWLLSAYRSSAHHRVPVL